MRSPHGVGRFSAGTRRAGSGVAACEVRLKDGAWRRGGTEGLGGFIGAAAVLGMPLARRRGAEYAAWQWRAERMRDSSGQAANLKGQGERMRDLKQNAGLLVSLENIFES
jgi:hypothetical protein